MKSLSRHKLSNRQQPKPKPKKGLRKEIRLVKKGEAKNDLAASIALAESQVIGASENDPNYEPIQAGGCHTVLFDKEFVNQGYLVESESFPNTFNIVKPFDTQTSSYTVLEEGIYEVSVTLSIFLLCVSSEPGQYIELENLSRISASILKQGPKDEKPIAISTINNVFKRDRNVEAEAVRGGLNDVEQLNFNLQLETGKNETNIQVDDRITVQVILMNKPEFDNVQYWDSVVQGEQRSECGGRGATTIFNMRRIATKDEVEEIDVCRKR